MIIRRENSLAPFIHAGLPGFWPSAGRAIKRPINVVISRLSVVLSLEATRDSDALGQNRLIFLKSFLNHQIREMALIRWLPTLSHQEKREIGVLDEDDVKNNYF